jgi:hypothetical protein
VAVEVKLGLTPTGSDVHHLLWLRDRLGPDLLDAVVVTAGAGPAGGRTASAWRRSP